MIDFENIGSDIDRLFNIALKMLSDAQGEQEITQVTGQIKSADNEQAVIEIAQQNFVADVRHVALAVWKLYRLQYAVQSLDGDESNLSPDNLTISLAPLTLFQIEGLLNGDSFEIEEHRPLEKGKYINYSGEAPTTQDYDEVFLELLEKRYSEKTSLRNLLELQIARCALSNDPADKHLFSFLTAEFKRKKYKYSWGEERNLHNLLKSDLKRSTAIGAVKELLMKRDDMSDRSAVDYVAKKIDVSFDRVRNWYRTSKGITAIYPSPLDTIDSPPFPWDS
jgi:hypothetical protein